MCYYIIQNIIETNVILTSLVPRLHLQRFGRWSLGTNLDPGTFAVYLPHRRHVMPSRLPPRDCVSRALEYAPLCRAVCSPGPGGPCGVPLPRRGIDLEVYVAQDATSRYCTRSSHGFILASSLAEPRPRIPTPRVYVTSRSSAISHVA